MKQFLLARKTNLELNTLQVWYRSILAQRSWNW